MPLKAAKGLHAGGCRFALIPIFSYLMKDMAHLLTEISTASGLTVQLRLICILLFMSSALKDHQKRLHAAGG